MLLHPGGLRGPGEDGAGPPREPQASTSMYLFVSVLTLSKVNYSVTYTDSSRRNFHIEETNLDYYYYYGLYYLKLLWKALSFIEACTVGSLWPMFYTWTLHVYGLCRRLDTCLLLWGCVNKLWLPSQG